MTREESLKVIPLRRSALEETPLSDGGRRVAVEVAPGKWQKRILRLPDRIRKSYDLDRLGVYVLDLCDGKNNVLDLIRKFGETYSLEKSESERAVLVFLKTLTSRGLVDLIVPK